MGAGRESAKHFANTTSVQNLDPETVLKFMNRNAIDKTSTNVIAGKKLKMSFLDFLPTCSCVLVDFNT